MNNKNKYTNEEKMVIAYTTIGFAVIASIFILFFAFIIAEFILFIIYIIFSLLF